MRRRLSLAFPYLFALVVAGIIFWCERPATVIAGLDSQESSGPHICLPCSMEVGKRINATFNEKHYYFCTEQCRTLFLADPERYLIESCLVCKSEGLHEPVKKSSGCEAQWEGKTYFFCSTEHREAFRNDPGGYFMHTMWGIPGWLYYASIAVLLILSFGIIEWKADRQKQAAHGAAASSASSASFSAESPVPRYDLLSHGWIRRIFIHPATRFISRMFVVELFVLILIAGLFGNQLPSKNIAPILTWTIWWGGLIWLVAYLGKAWCYVCPWDAIAEWAEGLRLWGRRKTGMSLELKWPRWMRNIWPATVLFIGLTWIELGFGVTLKPRATAWLGLTMLLLAFSSAFIFDRKSFCRYGCLVGRISGLYALFSPVEVRAGDHGACQTCHTHSCFKGNDKGDACPTFEHLGKMKLSTYCISCMECVKTCEKQNVSFRLRPWGSDLADLRKPRSDEAYLALIMLSLTGFHGLTMTGAWQGVVDSLRNWSGYGEILSFSTGMAAVMVAPVLLYALLVALSRWFAGRNSGIGYKDYFLRYAYALLPIALFYHLAHNSEHLLMEGQKVITLASDPFGYQWNLFGTADWSLPPLISLPTLWIVQVLCVMVGHVYSLWAARRAAEGIFSDSHQALRSQLPMLVAMICFSLMSLWLLKQPMQMRISAM